MCGDDGSRGDHQGGDGVFWRIVDDRLCGELVMDWCLAGLRNRAVASHNMNEFSSRSHTILTVYITSEQKVGMLGEWHLPDSNKCEQSNRQLPKLRYNTHVYLNPIIF